MGGVRNGNQRSSAGQSPSEEAEVAERVERHRRSAALLLKEGQAARAFGELARASRTLPMTPRLASALVAFSLRAGTEAAAIALLSSALAHTRGPTRRAVRLQLVRVLRRVEQLPRALEMLQALVAEAPEDTRARRLLELLTQPPPIVRGEALEEESAERHETVEVSMPWSQEEMTNEIKAPAPQHDAQELTRLEAQLIARRAWRELAQFYLARVDETRDPAERVDVLTRLAELLENELQDPAGAARAYGHVFALTGDRAVLAEQVRLVSQRGGADDWAVWQVLDEAVQRARTPRARASAFLARAERLLATGALARARVDFEVAESLVPGALPVLMGLARCATGEDQAQAAERLRTALAAVPRRAAWRGEGLKCLAELAGGPLADARLAHWAWTELLAEHPEDLGVQERLLELARQLGDREGMGRLLRVRLAREPRGPAARKARLELVATLEADGHHQAALAELRQAVRFEPGHKEAWLLLVERLGALGQSGEAAWALEHAATATEDDAERQRTWERLARYCREVLGDAARARVYARRAENLRRSIAERLSPALHPEPPSSANLRRADPGPTPRTAVLIPPPGELELTPVTQAAPPRPDSAPTVLELPAIGDFHEPPAEVEGTQVLSWEAPPGKAQPARRRAGAEHSEAFARVQSHPLDTAAYRELSAFFARRGDAARSELMMEVAVALEGGRQAVPRVPRRTLTAEERAGLRHPGLRNPAGELLVSVGFALCRLFPTYGRAAGSTEPLRPDSGPGARGLLEVLRSVAGLLDVQLPEVCLAEDDGPPLTLVHPGAPRLLVGRLAVRQAPPEPELRFHAGRALACLAPDVLALRCLRKDQLLRAVAILASVLRGGTDFGPEARVVREALHPKARARALELLEVAQREFDAAALAEAARHSTNRTGLVVCGGPGPALAALRALKASEQEVEELVRFAASERYVPLRG